MYSDTISRYHANARFQLVFYTCITHWKIAITYCNYEQVMLSFVNFCLPVDNKIIQTAADNCNGKMLHWDKEFHFDVVACKISGECDERSIYPSHMLNYS